jgi:diguanylate cyclase (GGDEF)-like protein
MVRQGFIFAARLGSICLLALVSLRAEQPLTSISAVHAISNQTAARSIPVAFEGSVTYYEKGNVDLFVQDGDAAVYVETTPDLDVTAGDRVLVEGITRASFRPEIAGQRVTFLRHGTLPRPVEANFTQLIRAELDCRMATVRAIVRAAEVFTDGPRKSILLDLLMPGGPIEAQIAIGSKPADLLPLLDSTIEITGAVAGRFDNKNQMTGVLLEVPSFDRLRIVEPPARSPRGLAPRKFDEILHDIQIQDQTERVRVEGTVTYYQAGAAMVLQDGPNALWLDTLSEEPHAVGSHVLASGFPDVRNGSVVLTRSEIESTQSNVPLSVANLNAAELASGSHAFDLVSVEGQLVMRVREAAQDQYVIASHGHVFSAIYRHPERGLDLPLSPMRDVRLGSRVRVTGICVLDRGDQFRGQVAFHLLLRSSDDDIAVLAGPSVLSVRNLVILLVLLLVLIFVVIAKAFLLERRLRRQDVTTATTIERWRTRVIDGINNAIPLRDTMLQITELLSFKMQAEFCWVDVDLEGIFGICPGDRERSGLEIIEQEIPARSGATLGKICVAVTRRRAGERLGPGAFDNAVRLAALAIETGGKYSELVRRSELDPLTNAQNRFAFDRSLDMAIEKQHKSGGRLGLIYIDLDEFKLVNDRFGHQIGDQFLQETALRMGDQLRPNDVLARMGGDEFAVLVTDVNRREEVSEIALRLQSCFDTPFCLDLSEIRGSASIGCAVYPDDASTPGALLECADAGMYKEKRQKRRERTLIQIEAEYGKF